MTQPPYLEDRAKLPVGLYIQRVYIEMKDGSQNVSTVLHNSTGKPMQLVSGWLVGCIVAANQYWMPWVPPIWKRNWLRMENPPSH